MSRILATLTGLAVILGTGVVHGLWTGRWQQSPEFLDAVARLDRLPGAIGLWQPEDAPLDPEEIHQANAARAWSRIYTHRRTQNQVRVILLCGRSGPMSVHRPEHCYRGAGFEMTAPPVKYTVKSVSGTPLAEVWTARFSGQDETGPRHLRIFWTWYACGRWQAPDSPRLAFAPYKVLYKLYVVSEMNTPQDPLVDDPAVDFLRKLIPDLAKSLSSPDGHR
jgi:hypothetical protein